MYPVHDVDAILLLAMLLACKRQPADLVEIIAAIDLTQGAIPPALKLSDSFYRLSEYGLIFAPDGGYALTPNAQQLLSGHAKKAKTPERIFDIKEKLADVQLDGVHSLTLLSVEQLATAITLHESNKHSSVKNLLIQKPKVTEDKRFEQRRPGQPFSSRRNTPK